MTAGGVASASRLASVVPALTWLRTYQRAWLRADLIAGLTVWAVVVPQAIAYAQIAGLAPQAGLFGTSRQLVVSPTSGSAAVSAVLVSLLALDDPERFAGLAALLAILTGVVYVLLGWRRTGFVSQFVSTSVQIEFLFGLG